MFTARHPWKFVLIVTSAVIVGSAAEAQFPKPPKVNNPVDELKKFGGHVSDVAKKEGDKLYKALIMEDRDTLDGANVIIFEHNDGKGVARGFRIGDEVKLHKVHNVKEGRKFGVRFDSSGDSKFKPIFDGSWENWDDKISSFTILDKDVKVILYAGRDFDGENITRDSQGFHDISDTFNDKARSIKVVKK